MSGYDPDVFDAEIILDRTGISQFTAKSLADLFGVHPETVRSAVSEGRLEPAKLRVRVADHAHIVRHEWSKEQVIRILASGRHPKPVGRAECGTAAGDRMHRFEGTPVCEPCRIARNAYNRERHHIRKQKKQSA